jgi:endonuclease/exonuclease/phosphatase family metal-dependent hydrolase
VRLLAYNIHHGEGMDEVIDLARIAELITDLDPDLVTLQEVDSVVERTGRVDQVVELARRTGLEGEFGGFMPYQGGAYGMAVMSRWPILETNNWRLTDGEEPRTALGVRVQAPGSRQELVLVGIHLYRTEEERLAQATDLDNLLAGETAPVILAGDFNSTPGSPVMTGLGEGWRILDKGRDRFTFSSFAPEREIDYVLLRPSDRFEVLEHRPLDEPVISDHRPIWTVLLLKR